jgi:hypothetical protein
VQRLQCCAKPHFCSARHPQHVIDGWKQVQHSVEKSVQEREGGGEGCLVKQRAVKKYPERPQCSERAGKEEGCTSKQQQQKMSFLPLDPQEPGTHSMFSAPASVRKFILPSRDTTCAVQGKKVAKVTRAWWLMSCLTATTRTCVYVCMCACTCVCVCVCAYLHGKAQRDASRVLSCDVEHRDHEVAHAAIHLELTYSGDVRE